MASNPYSQSWAWTAPKLPSASSSGPSLNQMLARIAAAHTKPHRSFLGNVLHGAKLATEPVAWTFDKLERPSYAIANAVDKGVSYHHVDLGAAAHGAREGFMGREKTNFGQVFKHNHILDNHHFLRGALGLTADVVTDPLSYTGAGITRKAGTKALQAANEVLFKGTPYAAKIEQAAGRITELARAHDTFKAAGKGFEHRAAATKMALDANMRVAAGHALDDATRGAINASRNAAKAEQKLVDKKILHLRVGPNSGGLKVPLTKLPQTRLGEAGIPGISRVAAGLGKAFKPGYEDPILHAQLLGRRHQGERLALDYFNRIRDRFHGLTGLSEKEQRAVLHYFEKPGKLKAVIKDPKTGEYILNPKHIERALKAGFTKKQIEFVKAMHDTGRFLMERHRAYGVDVADMAEKGKLYVPHIVTKTGEGITDAQRNLLTKRGFTKARKGDLSVAELHNLHEAGKLPHDIETNPYRLLTIHARSAANQHADQIMVNYMKDALGVPTKLVDKAALAKNRAAAEALQKQIAKYPAFDEQAHQAQVDALKAKHRDLERQALKDTLATNNEAIRRHLEDEPWKQTTKATVQRISNNSINAQRAHAEAMKAITEERHPGLLRELNPLRTQKADHAKNAVKLERNLTRLMRAQRKILGGTKNPEYQRDVMRTVDKLKNEFGHKMAFHTEIADGLERLEKVMAGDDATLNAFSNGYRKWLGKWKVAVTTVNPSYGVRNTLSDFWNMYLSGVPIHAIPVYGAKAAKLMADAKAGNRLAISKMLDAYDSGILSGLFAGDIQQVSRMLEHGNSSATLFKRGKGLAAINKVTQDFNRNRENWGRLTHYLYRLDQGHGVAQAADFVKAAHFDYEDLTEFEQKRMKLIAPFYTWSRKNIPFQIRAIVEHPGQMAAFPQFAQEASGNTDSHDILPPYMEQGMYLKLGGKYFNPMIGVQDLQNAAHPIQGLQNLLSPAIKTPFELLTNHSMLTDQPIKDPTSYSRNPIHMPPILGKLLGAIPGSDLGETGRKLPNGKMVHGEGASPYLTYLLGQTPLTNALFNKGGAIRDAQHPSDQNRALLTELTGINGQTVDQQQQIAFEQLALQDRLKQIMKDLRAEGLIPPAKKGKVSQQQKIINGLLERALRGR